MNQEQYVKIQVQQKTVEVARVEVVSDTVPVTDFFYYNQTYFLGEKVKVVLFLMNDLTEQFLSLTPYVWTL